MDLIDLNLNSTYPLSDRSPSNKEGYSGHQFEALDTESEDSEDYYPKKRRATELKDTMFSESLAEVILTIVGQTKRCNFFFRDGNTLVAAAQGVDYKKRASWTERQKSIDDDRIQMISGALDMHLLG